MARYDGATTLKFRRELAVKVFSRTSDYDWKIACHLIKQFKAEELIELNDSMQVLDSKRHVPLP